MSKKLFCVALCAMFLTLSLPAEAQQARNIPRAGYLSTVSPSAAAPSAKAFREGLALLGYIEGQNIAIEYRYAEGKLDRLPDLARGLVRLKVDVVVTAGATATKAVQKCYQDDPNCDDEC
jgi:putative ABC transport system substrate-binding protein